MQSLTLKPGQLPPIIEVPSSKSYANRALVLASLKKERVKLLRMPQASDVTHLISALKKVGLDIEVNPESVEVLNSFPGCEKKEGAKIEVGEGGTTARFLASLLCLGSAPYTLILGERLKERPWDEFLHLIHSLGVKAELKNNELFIQGPLNLSSSLEIDCSRTTQFASGLQLALAYTECKVVPVRMNSSQSYWKMTEHLIEKFQTLNEFEIPLDWSSASYPMVFAALKQEIFFPHLKIDPFQADAKLSDILKKLGSVKEEKEGLRVAPLTGAHSFKLDVSDCLDLVPSLAFLFSHIPGHHILSGIENLKHKESDRLLEVQNLLKIFHRKTQSDSHQLEIFGSSEILKETVHLVFPDDHRLVMTGALFLRFHAGGTLLPIEAVQKSYPSFFSLF